MIVFDLVGTEKNPAYQTLSIENLDRQYSFLRSVVVAALALERPLLSIEVIRALNYHAVSCLHATPGEFRPCSVRIGDPPTFEPPEHWRVPSLMNMFVDEVNRLWGDVDAVYLASYVLWRLNDIHPFVNGNGRTARAACYYVLCLRLGGWLSGTTLLPELIRQNRQTYVAALQAADRSFASGALDLTQLHTLLQSLLAQQLATVPGAGTV